MESSILYLHKNLAAPPSRSYKKLVKLEFDPLKSEKNAAERGLPFAAVEQFAWETAQYSEDRRRLYPERRIVAVGFIGNRLHVVCFTPIPNGVRVISFRKANDREERRYEQTAADGR